MIHRRHPLPELHVQAIILHARAVDVLGHVLVDLLCVVCIELDLILVQDVEAASHCAEITEDDLPII
jgi:hypothetical protein